MHCSSSTPKPSTEPPSRSRPLLVSAPLFHWRIALNTAWLAPGTVVPRPIKPTRLVGHRLCVAKLTSCDCVFHEPSHAVVSVVNRAPWPRRPAFFFPLLPSWVLSFAGLLLELGLHNHQEEQQQDHQLVPH